MTKNKSENQPQPEGQESVTGDERLEYLPEPLVQAPGAAQPERGQRPPEPPKAPKP